jgi:hypothetical protein
MDPLHQSAKLLKRPTELKIPDIDPRTCFKGLRNKRNPTKIHKTASEAYGLTDPLHKATKLLLSLQNRGSPTQLTKLQNCFRVYGITDPRHRSVNLLQRPMNSRNPTKIHKTASEGYGISYGIMDPLHKSTELLQRPPE